ncbi:MAG: glycosyltransferase family 39 protein [Anaerolineae bacterium]|nr:MAG: glycosyltransferase family 39 protein [Anaerolineae bacterium]
MNGLQARRWHLILILALLLLAFALRIYRLPEQSLWYDEALSVYYARQSLPGLLAGVSGSDHPPLHSLLLHGWIALAGRSEFAVRYLSLWWGVLGVALLCLLGKRLFDEPTALLATALLAISPFHVWYSQEARMYSLAVALSLGVVLALQAVVARGQSSAWPWVSYVLAGALALYAHFFTSFILIFTNLAFCAWWLVRAGRAGWSAMRCLLIRWAIAQLAVLLLFLPWGRFVAEQVATNATYWHGALGLGQIIRDTALAFAAGDQVRTPLAQATTAVLATVALLGLQVATSDSRDSAASGLSRRQRALWLLLWLVVPVAALFVVSHDRPKFAPRYLLPALPALLLLIAAAGARLASLARAAHPSAGWPHQRWLAASGLLLASTLTMGTSAISLQQQFFEESLARPDFRAVADYVEDHAQPDDVVVVIGGHGRPALEYYFDGALPVHPMPPDLLPTTRRPLDYGATAELGHVAAGRNRLWLVLWQDRLADPTEVVLSHLLRTCPRLDVGQMFHQVALLLFSVADCDLAAQSRPAQPFQAEFGGQMRLLGFDLEPPVTVPGAALHLALYWEAIGKVDANYTTFVQLLGPDGRIYAQHDRVTGDDTYPTSRWQPGALVRNAHILIISPDAQPGTYDLFVGLYVNQGNLPRLPVTYPAEVVDDAVVLTRITVQE